MVESMVALVLADQLLQVSLSTCVCTIPIIERISVNVTC
jgi:hypothetical protein